MDPKLFDDLYEAQKASNIVYKCSKCGHTEKGPLPGFPVYWQQISYSVLGYAVHSACGGYMEKQPPPFRYSMSTQIMGVV